MKKSLFITAAAAILMFAVFFPFAVVKAYEIEPSWFTSPMYEDVYLISSEQEMDEFILLINEGCDFLGKTVCLTDSVTLSLTSGASEPFRGTFNGLGHTIFIGSGSKSHLFSELDGAEISNLTVSASGKVTLLQGVYGSPVALSATNTLFDSVRVSGSFEFAPETDEDGDGEIYSGILAGYAEATDFFNCVSDVTSSSPHGGIAGVATLCSVENSCFTGGSPFLTMEECNFNNVLSMTESDIEGVTGYATFADADEAVLNMNVAVDNNPDYDRWLVESGKPQVHAHSVDEIVNTPATCTQKGRLDYYCVCGKALLGCVSPTIPHVYSDPGAVVEPTCTEDGCTLHICDVCGQEFATDIVPKIDHITELVGSYEPTCSKRGYTGDQVCVVCGLVVEKGTSVKATGQHDWGNMQITKAPTADEPGKITLYCLNCKTKTVETVPALGHVPLEYEYFDEEQHRAVCTCGEEYYYGTHKWDAGMIVVEPTADDAGEILYTCTVCKATKTAVAEALGHNLVEWLPYDGVYHASECSCGEKHKEEHQFDGGVEGEMRVEDGVVYQSTVYTCVVCGAQQIVEEIKETVQQGGENESPRILRNTQITAAIIAGLALLLVGGVVVTVFIRKSDRI